MKQASYAFPACILASIVCGCANVKPTQTGYLSDYSSVQPDSKNHKLHIHQASTLDLEAIDSFYIEDVSWHSPRPKNIDKHPAQRDAILQSLREALQKDLAAIKPVLDQPGPHTARVRAAVTDEQDSNFLVNVIATIVAVPITNGGATIEAEVLAPDGHQLAAVNSARAGGVFDVFGYYLEQDHAKQACRKAAGQLADALKTPATPQVAQNK